MTLPTKSLKTAFLLTSLALFALYQIFVSRQFLTRTLPVFLARIDDGRSILLNVPQKEDLNQDVPESFSACLLVMDDNHRLSEWIAYHYFVLPLRYLIVAVDPASKTKPTAILDKWRSHGMVIVEWTDEDHSETPMLRDENDDPYQLREKHKTRQRNVYHACTRHMQDHNRTWTTYHDIDEFIAINEEVVKNADERVGKPASVLDLLQQLRTNSTGGHVSGDHYLHFSSPCITLPRTLYTAVESTAEEISNSVPDGVDANQLDTLRWRYRAGRSDGLAKSIIDASLVQAKDYDQGGNTHRPLKSICPTPWLDYDKPLGIHHYLGSWESYSFRDDARKGTLRSREVWLERSVIQYGDANDEVRPWIQGFVQQVGSVEAADLLEDAGLPADYRKSDHDLAQWSSILPELPGRRRKQPKGVR